MSARDETGTYYSAFFAKEQIAKCFHKQLVVESIIDDLERLLE